MSKTTNAGNREDYLHQVKGFVDHIKALLTTTPFIHQYIENKKTSKRWSCGSIEDALSAYVWNGKDFDQNNAELSKYSSELKYSIDNRMEFETLRTCIRILEWGGVRNGAYGVVSLYLRDNLSSSISDAVKELTSEAPDLNHFMKKNDGDDCDLDRSNENSSADSELPIFHSKFRMNASFTKIYSLYSDRPFIIYDSRVAAALGLIARGYLANRAGNINELLRFSYLEGRSGNRVRNASLGDVNFNKVSSERDHALWNIRANWIIEDALNDIPCFGGRETPLEKVRAVEAALFMIGKDIPREAAT